MNVSALRYFMLVSACAGIMACELTTMALPQTPNATAAPLPSSEQNRSLIPGFDDLMTMLIQPRHIKLYYAASAQNWDLAAVEAKELRSAFQRIGRTVAIYDGNDVNAAVTAFIEPKMQVIDAAITAKDSGHFIDAYKGLTEACNECHAFMEHPFHVIKVPDSAAATAFPDQDFAPKP